MNLYPTNLGIYNKQEVKREKMEKLPLRILVLLAAIAIVFSTSATASEADVTVTNVVVSPEGVEVGENVTITATVENTGNTTETVPIVFKINGEEVKSANVTVEANATEMVECMVAEEEVGTYEVTVDGASASFTVTTPPTPIPSPTPEVTPTPTPVVTENSEEKFRSPPSVDLRPVERIIDKDRDGVVEFYMDNPIVNDVVLTVDARIKVPSGIHVYGTGFGTGTAGVTHGIFTVAPGTHKGIEVRIKADESARIGDNTIVFSGIYYPGDNKDLYNTMSLTYPVVVVEPNMPEETPTPTPTETPKPPGFEAILAIAALLAVAYLMGRKK